MIKTLHEGLKEFDRMFTPGTNKFSEYVLWTSDMNGNFYRTCFMSKSNPQRDKEVDPEIKIIVALEKPFDIEKINYHKDYSTRKLTKLGLQVCWVRSNEDLEDMLEWNAEMGYGHRYVLDCSTGEIRCIKGTKASCPD